MIELLVNCEHADLGHACEESVALPLTKNIKISSTGRIRLATGASLPDGWGTVRERGANRIRCPEHLSTNDS